MIIHCESLKDVAIGMRGSLDRSPSQVKTESHKCKVRSILLHSFLRGKTLGDLASRLDMTLV
jgi:hypothetical protein